MSIRTSYGLRTALVAVAAIGWWSGANAQTTSAGISIANRATVSYSVGAQAQPSIDSSPTGNSTPGGGLDTTFLVDHLVDFTVSEVSGDATLATPGTPAALAFTITNTGNGPTGFALSFLEEVGSTLFSATDTLDFGNLIIRVDEDPSAGTGNGDGVYTGAETATAINVLNRDQDITVFIVSPTVLALPNAAVANALLQAQAALAGSNGSTLLAETGANSPTAIEIVFADDLEDGIESDVDQFIVQSAALTITKSQTVIADGFSASNFRSIPGATVRYEIEIENTSTTTAADLVSITDPVPTNTTFVAATPVAITNGTVASCTGDLNDADTDGCGIVAGALTVAASVIGSVTPSEVVTVAFQVTIN